jgi:GNAT superfamily N-acetyltransferase
MLEFRIARDEDTEAVRALYLRCFDDTPEGAEVFFGGIYSPDICYIAFDGGVLVAMLCMLPTSVNGRKAAYLYAAATDEEYRNCGFMRGLVNYAIATCGAELCVTLPAADGLYDFYKKLGFEELSVNTARLTREDMEKLSAPHDEEELVVGGYCGIRNRVLKRDFLFWDNRHIENAFALAEAYGGKVLRSNRGYALFYENGGVCEVCELICTAENVGFMIADLLSFSGCEEFTFRLSPTQQLFDSKPERFSMVRYYTDYRPVSIYAGLTLE